MSPSARNLILANAATLALAIVFGWDAGWLMWPYWIQSVIIGFYAWRRMMSLREFTTAGLKSNGRPVPETEAGKRSVATFFLLHYGFFHFIYLFFLLAEHRVSLPLEIIALLGCGLSFVLSQRETFAAQHAADLQGRPNLGALMFLPYLRVLPMHLGIILAGSLGGGAVMLTVFVLLKTASDLGLDYADRRMAAKVKPAAS